MPESRALSEIALLVSPANAVSNRLPFWAASRSFWALVRIPAAVVALEPDVVLSDVRMPGDGYHLTDDLVGRHHPPIVLMSAWIIGVEEVRRHGAADLLQKPFDLEELLDRLSSAAAAGWKRPLKLQDAAEEAQEEQRTG